MPAPRQGNTDDEKKAIKEGRTAGLEGHNPPMGSPQGMWADTAYGPGMEGQARPLKEAERRDYVRGEPARVRNLRIW